MVRRGRPPSARAANARIVRLKLRLYPGEDDDLIAFFAAIPSGLRALSVKQALRTGSLPTEATPGAVPEALLDALDGLVFDE